ncbi:DUF647-domain-containing protein [Ramicandelaber brevisporus]|nr:DUF647-domain-containing protein [Ramicandelaber brevisporus]
MILSTTTRRQSARAISAAAAVTVTCRQRLLGNVMVNSNNSCMRYQYTNKASNGSISIRQRRDTGPLSRVLSRDSSPQDVVVTVKPSSPSSSAAPTSSDSSESPSASNYSLTVSESPAPLPTPTFLTSGSINDQDAAARSKFGRLRMVVDMFLPKGYPGTVTREYMPYAKWQFLHNATGAVTGVLSTQALLYAMGLGAGSVPMAAALNWIIKDGLGQLGGVLYASFVSDKFDSEPKRYKFWAGAILQLATLGEILAPLAPHMFLLIGSLSNIGKNVAWLASSATRAAIHQSFEKNGNLGDITGKSASQTTLAGLVGTGMGVLLCTSLDVTAISTAIAVFVPFSVTSMVANYKANSAVVTRTMNKQRAEMVIQRLIKNTSTAPAIAIKSSSSSSSSAAAAAAAATTTKYVDGKRDTTAAGEMDLDSDMGPSKSIRLGIRYQFHPPRPRMKVHMPTPREVSRHEQFVLPLINEQAAEALRLPVAASRQKHRVRLQPQLSAYSSQPSHADELAKMLIASAEQSTPYRIGIFEQPEGKHDICLWFYTRTSPADVFIGTLHAHLVADILDRTAHLASNLDTRRIVANAHAEMEKRFGGADAIAASYTAAQWDPSTTFIVNGGGRIDDV